MQRSRLLTHMLAALAVAAPWSSPASDACVGVEQERRQLEAERARIGSAISDLAMGATARRKPKLKGEQVGRAMLGTASSVLLPFGIGAALNLGISAAQASARKKGAPAARQAPDAEALIAREAEIDRRLEAIALECGAAPAR